MIWSTLTIRHSFAVIAAKPCLTAAAQLPKLKVITCGLDGRLIELDPVFHVAR